MQLSQTYQAALGFSSSGGAALQRDQDDVQLCQEEIFAVPGARRRKGFAPDSRPGSRDKDDYLLFLSLANLLDLKCSVRAGLKDESASLDGSWEPNLDQLLAAHLREFFGCRFCRSDVA